MKRKIFLDLLLALLTGLLVLCFQQDEQRNSISQLNRNGLSENSLQINQHKKMAVEPLIKSLAASKLTNFQIQFIAKDNPNFSYVYAKGKTNENLPVLSGRTFNTNDYQSEVPFVVLGKNQIENTYQPQSQMYYQYQQQYLAVIGTVGTAQTSAINDHTFISLSPEQPDQNLLTSSFRIVYDPVTLNTAHTKQILKMFQASTATRLIDSSTVKRERQGWFERSGILLTQVILIFTFMVIITWALVYLILVSGRRFQLGGFLRDQLTLKLIGEIALNVLLSTIAGLLVGWQVFQVSHLPIIAGLVGIFDALTIIISYLYMTNSRHYAKLKKAARILYQEQKQE